MKQREGFKILIAPECKERIARDECPTCGKPNAEWNRRKDWRCCSVECTNKFETDKILRSWTELRTKAIERDNFKCVKCGKQSEYSSPWMKPSDLVSYLEEPYYKKRFRRIEGDNLILVNDSGLIGDHIIPIALGGDEWDINNVQTLCEACNKIKTKEDMKKIAEARSIEKKLIINKQLK